jgi:hypothetical protein
MCKREPVVFTKCNHRILTHQTCKFYLVCVIEYDEGWQRAEIECNWCREKVGLPKHVMVDGWIQEREWIRRRKKSEKVETDKGGRKRDKEARAGDDILETSEGAPETLGDGEAEAGGRDWNG